jgi:intracellular septation protein
MHPLVKLALEIGPLAVFFLSYRSGEALLGSAAVRNLLTPLTGAEALAGTSGPIFVATAFFMVAIAASLAASLALTRHLPRMSLLTAVVVAVFGGLTLWLKDDTFIKMKPTILNGLFALILGVGLAQGRSYLKYLMGETMPLDDAGWLIFTRRWTWFFIVMAVLNEVIWRTQSTETWVAFKTFAYLPLTFAFVASQLPMLKRHMIEEN